jgi:glutaredoxin 2
MVSGTDSHRPDEKLSLYVRDWCGACFLVKRTIARLGIDIELRDIFRNGDYYDELLAARGRGTVPVLRRDFSDGRTEWMPESRDIIDYLDRTYGKQS